MQVLEKDIENKACRKIKQLFDVEIRKMNGGGNRAWPDRLFLFNNGAHLFIEFKRPGEKVRPNQEYAINRLRSMGHEVEVCETVEAAIEAARVQATPVSKKRNKVSSSKTCGRLRPRQLE